MRFRYSRYPLLAAVVVLFGARDAHAYVDPGTGSLILQAVIGTVTAGLVGIRLGWHRIKAAWTRSNGRRTDLDGESEEETRFRRRSDR